MDKSKLAICMKDQEFQSRFVNCFMNHYKQQYEVHVFTNLNELKARNPYEYSVIITEEYTLEEIGEFVERKEIILYLKDGVIEEKSSSNIIFVDKYQEVYKIVDSIQKIIGGDIPGKFVSDEKKEKEVIGVFSLNSEELQLPFTATLASFYGEEHNTILIDMQAFSGLGSSEEQKIQGMEDLIAVSTTGNYTRGRIIDCIRHEANWDYVYPIRNSECLLEGSIEVYKKMIDILVSELNYDKIIINFGTVFQGMMELMALCDTFYMPKRKGESGIWREKAFMDELERKGKNQFFNRVIRVEIPPVFCTDEEWRKISDQWRWNSFGDNLRREIGRKISHGSTM